MIIRSVLGHYVYLDSRQEAALALAEKIHQELEKEKREKEERLLQDHLKKMEGPEVDPCLKAWESNPWTKYWREKARKKFLAECAPKHHAWEYTKFHFYHEEKEYLYDNGDIIDLSEIEEFIL